MSQKDRGTVQSQQTFTVQGQRISILSLVGHMVSITTTQFCHCSMKAATDIGGKM